MRTITITKNLYTFEELNAKAKEHVINNWLVYDAQFEFDATYEYLMEDLRTKFPQSDLKIQCDVSGCQGSGLNIYGWLSVQDFMPLWNVTPEEKAHLTQLTETICNETMTFSINHHYCYSRKFIDEQFENLANCYNADDLTSADESLINQFESIVYDYFKNLEKTYYTELNNCYTEECAINYFTDMDFEFTEDGDIY